MYLSIDRYLEIDRGREIVDPPDRYLYFYTNEISLIKLFLKYL